MKIITEISRGFVKTADQVAGRILGAITSGRVIITATSAVPGAVVVLNRELREDAGLELREDDSAELRE
jgi:hypothetical protein